MRTLLGALAGFWGALGLLWLARKHRRKMLYRLIGFDVELDEARRAERKKVRARFAADVGAVIDSMIAKVAENDAAQVVEWV